MNKICNFLLAALAAMLLLTGCGGGEDAHTSEEYHCVICLGCHSNAPKVNLALVEDEIYRACRTGGSVTLIVIDGEPFPTSIDIPEPESGLSEAKYEQIARQYTAQIMEVASQLQARTDEVDTLLALQLGARAINGAHSDSGRTLVRELILIDSCLSTRGALSFVGCDIAALDSQQIAEQLKQMKEIPSLKETDVYVYSLGDVAGAQKALSQKERENLKAIWETILTEAGAIVHMRDDLPLEASYDESLLPGVSEVEVHKSCVDMTAAELVGELMKESGKVSFGEDVIRFEPGSGVLEDPEAAAAELAPTAEYLRGSGETVLVCGTTARWGTESYCMNLSQERGETIRTVLMELGVDADCLKVVPLGYGYAPFYTNDQNADGTLNDDLAPLNRNVHLVLISSDLGRDILEHANMGGNYGI